MTDSVTSEAFEPAERRAYPRKPCDIPLTGIGVVQDISLGGLAIQSDALNLNQTVFLMIPLASGTVSSKAIVVNQSPNDAESSPERFGLHFFDMDPISKATLLDYVEGPLPTNAETQEITHSLENFIKQWPSDYSQVSEAFKKEIADFRLCLSLLKSELEREEEKLRRLPMLQQQALGKRVLDLYEAYLQEKVHNMILSIHKVIEGFSEEEHRLHRRYFQAQLLEFSSSSHFFERAMNKPLGYAGDFEMMEILYHGLRAGSTLWQKIINSCLTSIPLGTAVRNRAWYLSSKIREVILEKMNPTIMSLACGPCEELAILLEKQQLRGNYICVDQDHHALKYAYDKLQKFHHGILASKAKLDFRNHSVRDFLKDPQLIHQYPPMDLIYTAGLFDYLDDSVASRLIEKLYSFLKVGGQLIVGNFKRCEYSYFIEYASEWYLKYRDETELMALVPKGLEATVKTEQEKCGVNLFLCISKT